MAQALFGHCLLIILFSLLPFMRIFLRLLYNYALKKIAHLSDDHEEIVDILLISKLDESDFVYGSSEQRSRPKDGINVLDFIILMELS